jgi:DNA-binding transcriptional LysR family regulator
MNQLPTMRAFVRVVETGSFSRASDQLDVPRSTVSKLIGDLETHLGNKLMHRTTCTVAATADGLDERIEIDAGALSTNDSNGLLTLLRDGMGVGQHFARMVKPLVERGELVPLLQAWTQPSMPFHILYPPSRHQSARLQVFLDWLIATFRNT